MSRIKTFILVAAVCLSAAAAAAAPMTKEQIDATWERLMRLSNERRAGAVTAEKLRAELDAAATDEPLYTQWKRMTAPKNADRLVSAWSVLKKYLPDGDVARWNEVDYFELPSQTPRAFIIIDALYAALMDLPKREGGEWLAADLLRQFSRSSHGRLDFLTTCPAEVAEAVADVAERTGLIGNWKAQKTVGTWPIARTVRDFVTTSRAISDGMQFLDGAGIPASNGFYAWDRKSGKIYRIIIGGERIIWVRN